MISSMMRFGIEFLRFHQQALIAGLSLTQWISLALAIAGGVLLAKTGNTKPIPQPAHA